MHHIFPKSQLYKLKHKRADVNALANFCFLTKDSNLSIGYRPPEDYFPEVEERHPGALASQWIPVDRELWKLERYMDFLEARKGLLAAEANRRLTQLLHGDDNWLAGPASDAGIDISTAVGGVTSEVEEAELEALNDWIEGQGLPRGELSFDYADPHTGAQKAVFDLAWPDGLQPGLTSPVAVLLNESSEVVSLASAAGFRCFTSSGELKRYVSTEILNAEAA